MLPRTRKEWLDSRLFFKGTRFHVCSERVQLRENVQWLLEHLYVPHTTGYRANGKELKRYGMNEEPINWGNLGVVEVQRKSKGWDIFLEEAAPDCPNLSRYIEEWMVKWGWSNIRVRTEW